VASTSGPGIRFDERDAARNVKVEIGRQGEPCRVDSGSPTN